jgi:hypothetical protein
MTEFTLQDFFTNTDTQAKVYKELNTLYQTNYSLSKSAYTGSSSNSSSDYSLAELINSQLVGTVFRSKPVVKIQPRQKAVFIEGKVAATQGIEWFPPYSDKCKALFEKAISELRQGDSLLKKLMGEVGKPFIVTESWADPQDVQGDSLHWLLSQESQGLVGNPNYTYQNWIGNREIATTPGRWPEIWKRLAERVPAKNYRDAFRQFKAAFPGVI